MNEPQRIILSIVIPIYKVEQYIERCVRSVMQQAMDNEFIECIFVDDCSPDDSVSCVERLLADWQGTITFVILHHEHNRGLSAARNTGIEAARGELLLFVDSDDYLPPGAIRCMLDAYRAFPNIDVIVGNAFQCEWGTNQLSLQGTAPVIYNSREVVLRAMCRQEICRSAWNKLVRRQLVVERRLYFDEGLLYEDVLWTSHLFSHVDSVMLLPQVTYVYEYNASSIMQTTSARASHAVQSYTHICRQLLCQDYGTSLAVEQRLYAFGFLLRAVDIASQYIIDRDVSTFLSQTKREILLQTFHNGMLAVAFFMLSMYAPFRYMFKWRLFRSNFDRLADIVRKIS